MAYIDGPMIDKVLIKGVLHPIADNRIEGTNFAYVQIAGDVVVDTPLTAEQLEHIKPAVLSEDGAVFNIPALGTILIPKDVVIQDPAPAEDYKVVYTSSPLEGKVYNLEVTIDHTTSEPKEAVVVEGEVATPPVNIAKTDLEAIKATDPDPTSHIINSDEAKALGQEAVDKKANIIVETDADGHPIDVYHAVESPEPDKYYRYQDADLHCIDIYFTKDASGVVTADGLLFPDQENIYVEKAKEYMEISTTQNSVVYKSVQPVMVEEHVLGFEEVEASTQTQGVNGIIHYPKSVLFTSPAAFTLALEGQDGYARPADVKIEISTDGLNWEESDATAMVADMNTELGKYALFVRCNDYLVSDTLTSWVHFVASTGGNITVRGILNAMFGGKPVRDRVCTGLFKNMTQLVDAKELLIPAEAAKVNSYSSMFEGCTSLTEAPALPTTTVGASAYAGMFKGCTAITKAPYIAATTLGTSCYANMFEGCTALVTAPALPALTAANKCYYQMFQGCIGLVSGPAVLPATTLDGFCYQEMFKGCTSLVNAPSLPAMDIKGSSYESMFEGCTALVNAPALPAITFDATGHNYQAMFSGCTALAKAPELPATTLAQQCYLEMFKGCTALTEPVYFPEIATGGMKEHAMQSMFENCTGIKWATAGKEYKIAVGGGITGSGNTTNMFKGNDGDVPEGTGSPEVNKTYYLAV